MRISAVLCVVLALASGCGRLGSGGPDAWRKDWVVIANATESNVHKDGYLPFGWHADEIGPNVVNRPYYEGAGHHAGIMVMHPITASEPARLSYSKVIPVDRPWLHVVAGGNVHGDCILACVVDGKEIGRIRLDGQGWTSAVFDLQSYAGQKVDLQLQNIAGGHEPWKFEHCFIDDVGFASMK